MGDSHIDGLLNALENESNESIINLTSNKIKDQKNTILQRLQLSRSTLKSLHKKLKNYRYCDDVQGLQYGFYIRWIPLKNPDSIELTNGGFIVDIKIVNGQPHILCKNNMNRLLQVKFDEALIFQKISHQERIILGILDILSK